MNERQKLEKRLADLLGLANDAAAAPQEVETALAAAERIRARLKELKPVEPPWEPSWAPRFKGVARKGEGVITVVVMGHKSYKTKAPYWCPVCCKGRLFPRDCPRCGARTELNGFRLG